MPSTRERLVEAAAQRFYREGFRNVGLDQVLADVGISKTAFYKHFQCKEDLILAALDLKHRWLENTFRALIREHCELSPVGRLRALFDLADRIINTDDFQGCIFVNVSIEFPAPHEPAHVAAARNKQAIEEIVVEMAAEAGAADPRRLARELLMVMEGAYVTRHVTGNKQSIDVARRVGDLIIAAHLPEAAGRMAANANTAVFEQTKN